jgi:hypothetical protein
MPYLHLVAAVALLDTFPMPFADGVDMVYYQMKDILRVATA